MKKHTQISILLLRLAIGILFLYAGTDKLINGFSATGFLQNATSGPFASIFQSMANNALVDSLVIYGELGIGIAMTFGVVVRFAASMGILMMTLFYLAALPPEYGPVSEHIIYILVFVTLASYGAGRYFGLDSKLEKIKIVQKHKYLRYLLG